MIQGVIESYSDIIIEYLNELKVKDINSWYDIDGTIECSKEDYERVYVILKEYGAKLECEEGCSVSKKIYQPSFFRILKIFIKDERILVRDIKNFIISSLYNSPIGENIMSIVDKRDDVIKMTEDEYIMWRMSI